MGDSQVAASKRGKGPVITRYPLPPTPVPGISRYDPPSGVSLPPHPPPVLNYHSPAPYHQTYAPPYGAQVHHYDPYHTGQVAPPPPPPPPPSHYHHYRHPPTSYVGTPPGPPPYRPPNDHPGGFPHDHSRPQSTPAYGYPGSQLPNRPPPPLPHHYSYPTTQDYPRGSPPYSETPPSFHGSPPPHLRQARYSPPSYGRDSYGRDRSPRGQSRGRWQSPQYRQGEEDSRYRDRDYGWDRSRYPPRDASPPRQRYGQERSPHSRASAGDEPNRHDRRREKPQGSGSNRKSEKNHPKQASSQAPEKHSERPKAVKTPKQQRKPAVDTTQAAPAEQDVQWGLVVPYMPVWDFEGEEGFDSGVASDAEGSFEEDQDLEWTLGQLFAEWVPYYPACAISQPLPREYSEETIAPPADYDEELQTEYITATNVDQFATSVRETKDWRAKRLLPLWANPLEIHPHMLAKLPKPKITSKDQGLQNGSQSVAKKLNGRDRTHSARHDEKAVTAKGADTQQQQEQSVSDRDATIGQESTTVASPAARHSVSTNWSSHHIDDKHDSHDAVVARSVEHTQEAANALRMSRAQNGQRVRAQSSRAREDAQEQADDPEQSREHSRQNKPCPTVPRASNTMKLKLSLELDGGRQVQNGIELDPAKDRAGVPQATEATEAQAGAKPPERPSSRGSLRNWHSHRAISRQASIASDISRPESPLTPTEMALLGIEGFDDSDSESDHDTGAKTSLTPSPPPPSRQKHVHADRETSATKSRPMKRQAAAVQVEEATPRTKKRRQQVASAFSRRW
ncbi:hypothetical protein Micbo1qcDRAFT_156951 [Microdochium bolleyi]|uniref:Uncharacterized protein n=1 Tax=Microdochium bolleyi TaxID=196109 RepID=A0A136JD93_9PEZI|nr:hypothetical protein Micbo1qcDRAFT_156951 [Microdochium bolleyi]